MLDIVLTASRFKQKRDRLGIIITQMFTSQFFTNNRNALSRNVENALICIAGNFELQASADLAFPFRQDSSFWYLSGIAKPDMVLVIDTTTGQSTLLLPGQNEYQSEWDGELDIESLGKQSGITLCKPISDLSKLLRQAKKDKKRICYLAPLPERVEPYGFYANPARKKLEQEIKYIEENPIDIRIELAGLRQVKQPAEIKAIQAAIDVTAKALTDVRSRLDSFATEKELENAITASFYEQNSEGHAYEPIVASGKHASIIHYNDNSAPIKQGELVLLDVGAKVHGYAADISRTWAIGKPSHRQKELYNVVLDLQQCAFDMLKPGVVIREYQKEMELKAKELFASYGVEFDRYPHGFSHFLGLDVHDAGLYDQPLKENAVLTVEPGVYLPKEGIGIRIEDDVLITKNGCKNLSKHIPKVL